jgi:nucleoside-diphosphate-sugar epimerase
MKDVVFHDLYRDPIRAAHIARFRFFSQKSLLITGSSGMLGKALTATIIEMAKKNADMNLIIYLASRNWNGKQPIHLAGTTIYFITNDEARSGKYDFNFILHCASPSNYSRVKSLDELIEVNLNFLKDCIGNQTIGLTYISSGEVYGGDETTKLPNELELKSRGKRGFYPLAKLQTENFLAERNRNYGLQVKILRLFHTFGPGISKNDGRSFADFLYAGAESNQIVLKTDGSQVRSFLYLGDAVEAILHFSTNEKNFELHNIGSSIPVTIREFAEAVAKITQQKVIFRHDSKYVKSPFDVILPNIETAQESGWSPKTDLADSINQTIHWIRR